MALGLALALGLSPSPRALADAPIRLAAEAPPGFEELLRPQSTLVDLSWGGRRIGRVLAVFAPGRLRFPEPRAVVDLIPNIIGRERVISALSGDLSPHPELVCGRVHVPNCDTLEPDVAGIIFDSSTFTVRLFVNPAFLSSRRASEREFLPPPDTGLTFVQSLQANLATVEQSPLSIGVYSSSTLAFDETRLRAEVTATGSTGARIESARAEFDLTRSRITAGVFRPPGSVFARPRRIAGLSLAAGVDRLWSERAAYSNPIPLFLPRAARVSIYKDGRMLQSAEHEAGNILLDTTNLPDGAYDVTIIVHELLGGQWRQTHTVVKTARVPPAAYPLWILELGATLDEDPVSPIGRLGTTHRILPSLALGGDLFVRDDLLVVEAALFWMTPTFRLELAGYSSMAGYSPSELDGGLRLNATGRLGRRFVWSTTFRGVWRPEGAPRRPLVPNAELLSASGSLSWAPAPSLRLSARGRWTQPAEGETRFALGPALRWIISSAPTYSLSFDSQATWTQDDLHASAFLRLRITPTQQLNLNLEGGGALTAQPGADPTPLAPLGRALLTLNDGAWLDDDLTLRGGVIRGESSYMGQAEARYRGALGQLSVRGERPLDDDTRPGRLFASGTINGAIDSHGAIFGGDRTDSSAIVIQLDGDSRDTLFAVRVGRGRDGKVTGGRRGTIRPGQRLGIFLPPNHRYQVSLEQLEGDLSEIDLGVRSVTLLPGTVQTLTWTADELITVFGRLVDAQGQGLADIPLGGVRGIAATDANGYFLAQVRQRGVITATSGEGATCKIPLGRLERNDDGYVRLGTRTCR